MPIVFSSTLLVFFIAGYPLTAAGPQAFHRHRVVEPGLQARDTEPATSATRACLRTTDRVIQLAMARGLAHSPTFRAIVARLETSDLFIHIVRRAAAQRPTAFTQFVAVSDFGRYVRITLDADHANDAFVALLGHELRHAVEVADAPWVTDQQSYEELYRSIGRPSCGPPRWCFDTPSAVAAGRHVLAELRSDETLAAVHQREHTSRSVRPAEPRATDRPAQTD